jgi:hypothetical protein
MGPEVVIHLVHQRRAQGEPELEMSTQQAVDEALELVSASDLQHLAFPMESQVESAVLQGIGRNLNLTGEMVDPPFDSSDTGLLLRPYPYDRAGITDNPNGRWKYCICRESKFYFRTSRPTSRNP